MKFTILYDPETEEVFEKDVWPLVEDLAEHRAPFSESEIKKIEKGQQVLTYLSDDQLKELLPTLTEKEIPLAILPHPKARQICMGLGVDFKLMNALEDLETLEKPMAIDLMYCNGKPVFNNMVIGHAFQLTTNKISKKLNLWARMKYLVKRFLKLHPFEISVTTKEGKELNTTVSGIVIVQHGKSSLLSRLVLHDSFVNDGMLHSLLISPRSVGGLVIFAMKSFFDSERLPPFSGHIKTPKIKFEAQKAFEYSEDGVYKKGESLELEVKKKQVLFYPGSFLKLGDGASGSREIYKVEGLPSGEAAIEIAKSRLPFIRHASTEEFKELFMVLRENAKPKSTFLVLMILSTILATFGLFANSSPVVIGAMILAPLMAPIISLSMATLRQDKNLAMQSFTTILLGLAIPFVFAVVITLLTPLNTPNHEIMMRVRPNLLDLGIAVVSGVAGAYAHAREEIAKTLAGVAIAVALVPPLAVSAIGLGWADWEVFFGAMLLLLTNLGGMVLAAAFTFLALGYSPLRLATKGMTITVVLVGMLSVPLAFGFHRMVQQHKIVEKIDAWEMEELLIKDVKVQRNTPLTLAIKIVSSKPLDDKELENVKKEIEEKLGRSVELEITTAIKR